MGRGRGHHGAAGPLLMMTTRNNLRGVTVPWLPRRYTAAVTAAGVTFFTRVCSGGDRRPWQWRPGPHSGDRRTVLPWLSAVAGLPQAQPQEEGTAVQPYTSSSCQRGEDCSAVSSGDCWERAQEEVEHDGRNTITSAAAWCGSRSQRCSKFSGVQRLNAELADFFLKSK